jgi:hypothetical protein
LLFLLFILLSISKRIIFIFFITKFFYNLQSKALFLQITTAYKT